MSSASPAIAFHRGEGCAASIDLAALSRAFAAFAPHFPRRLARVDALLVGDEAMDAAHRRYMDIAGTTDVMSFPAHDESDAQAAVEVDLIVCVDVAARVAAARALIGRPALVIADEPTSSLDEPLRESFMALLMGECREGGSTLVFVSHDERLAAHFDERLSLRALQALQPDRPRQPLQPLRPLSPEKVSVP